MKKRRSFRSFLQKTYSEKNSRTAVQHEMSVTRRKCNTKRVQQKKNQYENSATKKKSSMTKKQPRKITT